jgi:similar to stage IV sporulation protein
MKNTIWRKFERIVEVKVTGKNINSYIKRFIIKRHINIFKITYLDYHNVLLILRYEDYLKLVKYKSIYDIRIVKRYGSLRFRDFLIKNYILFISVFLGISLIIFLSNLIFSIDVIQTSSGIRNLVLDELDKYGIKKYRFKKTYKQLEEIENKIIENNKDKLEWIEITSMGTKYIVRVEERILNSDDEVYQYQNIISKKNCVLYEVTASSGEKLKKANEYVKNGDVVISGYITKTDGSSFMTMAKGRVLGEVWYMINIDYPYTYYEEKFTGKKKKVYVINFLNKKINLFQFKKYHTFNTKKKVILNNNLINISFVREVQYDVEVISDIYTYDEAIEKAIEIGKNKLISDNNDIIKIKDVDIISSVDKGNSVSVKIFVKVIEDVSEIEKINIDS